MYSCRRERHDHPYGKERSWKLVVNGLNQCLEPDLNVSLERMVGERKDVPDLKRRARGYAATIRNGWPAWITKKIDSPEVSEAVRM